MGEKRESITYSTDWEDKVSKILTQIESQTSQFKLIESLSC